MKYRIKILLFVLAIVSYNGCKKDSTESTPTPTPPNKLCDGNGSASFFPLDSLNSWTYDFTIMGQAQTTDPVIYVTGHVIHAGKTYARTHEDSPFMQGSDRDLREDATTHNIYYYNDNDNVEYLDVPGSPTLNQLWTTSISGYTKKVTNLSASVATTGCSYTGLLEISEMNTSNAVVNKYYYKKGFGLVSEQGVGTFASVFKVYAVNLK